jgi:hypothetical protein
MRDQDIFEAIVAVSRKAGLDSWNTLFAHSVCPDEINHDDGVITDLLIEHFGEIFPFGGLAGIPFAGKTGFKAFASHVPENGHIFLLFAPHCAVAEDGDIGFYHRDGQAEETPACGAAIGAWNAVKDLEVEPEADADGYDFQFDYIKRLVWKHRQRIHESQSPIVEVTRVIYEHIVYCIHKIVDRKFLEKHKIMLCGGIQINVKPDDYFEPLFMTLLESDKTTDLLPDLLVFDKI